MYSAFKKIFFRVLGVDFIVIAFVIVYLFGKEAVPLFENMVNNTNNFFLLFLFLSTFFLGAPALFLVGFRLIFLRTFAQSWLYYLALPGAAIVYLMSGITYIYEMDALMSASVVYIFAYVVILYVLQFVHQNFYTSISHEKLHHIGLETPHRPRKKLHMLLWIVMLAILLIAHPLSIADTVQMLFSPLVSVIPFFN